MTVRTAVEFLNGHQTRSGASRLLNHIVVCSNCGSEYAQGGPDVGLRAALGVRKHFCQDIPCKAAHRKWLRNNR